jgi:hypothetical protein
MTHPTHKTRYSDSSLFDEICEYCGMTDRRGDDALDHPCPVGGLGKPKLDEMLERIKARRRTEDW